MPDAEDSFSEASFAKVASRVSAACARCGRRSSEVTIVGASKRQPIEQLRSAYEQGLRVFGENIVQEAVSKKPLLPPDCEWHLIGPLQSNKAKQAIATFDLIQSVDRLKIARRLDRLARGRGKPLPCFLQIRLGAEATKHGLDPEDLPAALVELRQLDALAVRGLMSIPPPASDPGQSRQWFRELVEIARGLEQGATFPAHWHRPLSLSMGMSGDFEVAIEEGATHVRVGTAIFGARTH